MRGSGRWHLACLLITVGCATTRSDEAASGRSNNAPERPNIVLILADDLGHEVLGCYGGESYATPRLDALAAGGLRFTEVYSQTLCTPSRVKLMTGRSNLRNYTRFSILNPGERSFAHAAREAGYDTVVVGKWQLYGARHYGEWAGRGTHPRDAGFDRWCLWQVAELGSRYADPTLDVDGVLHTDISQAYGPDRFCEYLLDFMREPRERPFLAYYPMALVHSPFEATPDSPDLPGSKQEAFVDMVTYMDDVVGRIEDELERLRLREDTLILFVSDNGTDRAIRSRMDGLEVRGAKGKANDFGTRVPFVASWPGRIPAGTECEDLIDLSDFMPTMIELMGVPREPQLDGRSFLPQLEGRVGRPREVLTIYSNPRPPGNERNPRVRFARDKRFKLYDDGRFFDTTSDPFEQDPLDLEALSVDGHRIRSRLQEALHAMPIEPEHLRRGSEAGGSR